MSMNDQSVPRPDLPVSPPAEPAEPSVPLAEDSSSTGSKDGQGAGDHDVPFNGFREYHFSIRQRTHLFALRGELQDAALGLGRLADDVATA